MELQGKVALVTGAAVRVGKAIALGLAREGARVALHYHRSESEAAATQAELEALGAEAARFQANLANVREIEELARAVHAHFGRIDVLVNNAAIYYPTPFGQTTEEQWDRLLDINLRAPFFCSQYVAEHMREGKIVNIADVAGLSPWPGYLPYSCSKAGLIALTRGLAKALAPAIQVNAIASGTVLLQEDASEEYAENIKQLSLLKRIGAPEDIVNTVLYLLKGTDFITGEVIAVDGGRHLL